MASQTRTAGTGASSSTVYAGDPTGGYYAWANPSRITADDASLSTVTFPSAAGTSNTASEYLRASNFGFSIPTGARIDGVTTSVEASQTGSFGPYIYRVRLAVGGALTAEDKANAGAGITWSGMLVHGGPSDTWSNALDSSIVNASNFGVGYLVVPLIVASTIQACTGSADVVTMTVDYTIIGPPVTTNAMSAISSTRARANGNITSTGGADPDIRGFVYDTMSHPLPGSIAPSSTLYGFNTSESGTFTTGAYNLDLVNISTATTYYVRAFTHNSGGYAYGEEVTFTSLNATKSSFTNYEITDIVKALVDFYSPLGGVVSYTGPSMDNTGVVLSYTFNTNTVLEGIQVMKSLAPADWYYYVDVATNILYWKQAATSADYTLMKGVHINEMNIGASIENLKNRKYVSGAEIAGVNLYSDYSNTASIAQYGQKLDRESNNRIDNQTALDALGQSSVDEQSSEKYQTTVVIPDTMMDITLFRPGQIVGFAGWGNFIDDLLLQITRIDYSPQAVQLTLGELPPQLNILLEQIRRGLIAQETVANPDSPT